MQRVTQQQQYLHHTNNEYMKCQHAYQAEGNAAHFLASPASSMRRHNPRIGCVYDSH
jgi:hypothetical protein